MILSICVITMNRASQLLEALKSCLACKLPDATEFVIVNNGSIDNTEKEIASFICTCPYPVNSICLQENIGVGPGRSLCYERANGEYLYFLDDDAVISSSCYDDFFVKSIELFENNPRVATITTRIVDEFCKRTPLYSKKHRSNSISKIYMFFGGSHFVRKTAFGERQSMYSKLLYGYEELAPSLHAYSKGFDNIYTDEIYIIHNPLTNKWVQNNHIEAAVNNLYHLKVCLFPRFFFPVIFLFQLVRVLKHRLPIYKGLFSNNKTISQSEEDKISLKTAIQLVSEFGFTIL